MRATCRRSLSQLLGTGSASLHPDYFIPKDKRLWSGTRGNTPPIGDRGREQARWNADREFLELATAGAAQVLGPDHGVTKALAKASITMDKVDLWHARLAVKTLRRDQREAIAEVGES